MDRDQNLEQKLPRRKVLEPHGHERVVGRTRVVQRRRRAVPGPPVVADHDVSPIHGRTVGNGGAAPRGFRNSRLAVGASNIFLGSDTRVGLIQRAGYISWCRIITSI